MLYPNCFGSTYEGVPCHPPDHICYAYPVGFAYPLLGFFGGRTTETADYPPLWTGKLKINGIEFDLENPADFGVNRNGVGIIAPQQYGWIYDGRYWSLAAGHRLVEHLPDVVIFPDYDIGYSDEYGSRLHIEHMAYSELVEVRMSPGEIISPKNCEEYGITAAELADPETMLSRCFCCGLGFPLAWLNVSEESKSSSRDYLKGIFPNAKPTIFYGRRGVKSTE